MPDIPPWLREFLLKTAGAAVGFPSGQALPPPTERSMRDLVPALLTQTMLGQAAMAFNRGAATQSQWLENLRQRPLESFDPFALQAAILAGFGEPGPDEVAKLGAAASAVPFTTRLVGREGGAAARGVYEMEKGRGYVNAVREQAKKAGFDTEKVYFHGTKTVYPGVPDPSYSRFGLFGGGAYFTEAPDVAGGYAGKMAPNPRSDAALMYTAEDLKIAPNIKPVYLNIKNPIDMDAPADFAKWRKAIEETPEPEMFVNAYGEGDLRGGFDDKDNLLKWLDYMERYGPNDPWLADDVPGLDQVRSGQLRNSHVFQLLEQHIPGGDEAIPFVQDIIERMGYDGITHIGGGRAGGGRRMHKVMIAFHPEQIMSAATPAEDVGKALASPFNKIPFDDVELDPQAFAEFIKRRQQR